MAWIKYARGTRTLQAQACGRCTLIQPQLMNNSLYSSITVTGADAFDFLQAQLSNDLRDLESRPVLLSAWCNPKGRVICLLRVRTIDDGYELTLPAELADPVAERLRKFRFRAQAEISQRPADLPALGIDGALEDWLRDNLRAGIPEIWAAQSEAFTPHMLNLDLIDAVSLDKGCYPGQEIVARTHYRGKSRRRMRRFDCAGPVTAGSAVVAGERKVGDVVNAIDIELLAVVPVDVDADVLTVDGHKLVARDLPYKI